MTTANQALPGKPMPAIDVATLDGGTRSLGGKGWKAVVVYRGAHCPLCKKYLTELEAIKGDYAAEGVELVAVSADDATRAAPFIAETGFSSDVGVGLTIEQMQALGLHISDPRSPEEAPAPFAEPGLFIVNADGDLQIADRSNAPFSRPDMQAVLNGIKFIQGKDYPIRGTHGH